MEKIYYNLESTEDPEENRFFRYLFPLTQINEVSKTKSLSLPLKLLTFLTQIQNILSLDKLYKKAKTYMKKHNFREIMTMQEFERLLFQTNNWIEEVKKILESEKDPKIKKEIMRKLEIFTIPNKLDEKIIMKMQKSQIKGIHLLREYLKQTEVLDPDSIQNKIFTIAKKDLGLPPRKLFEAIYQIILGKKSGPRLGSFLSLLDKSWLLERFNI